MAYRAPAYRREATPMDLSDEIEPRRQGGREFKVALSPDEKAALGRAALRNATSMAEVIRASMRRAGVLPSLRGHAVHEVSRRPQSTLGDTARRAGGLEPLTEDPADDDRSGGPLGE
jgi:hypothetical protein